MLGRSERLVRGGIAGSFAIGVAALSHVLGGGTMPSGLALVTGSAFAILLATLSMGRRPSLPRLGIAVAGSQLAFHVLFSYLSPGTGAHASGAHHGIPATDALDGLSPVPHAESPAMWVAHAVAMVATVLFLRRAELAVWRMVRREFDRIGSVGRILATPPRVPTARLVTGGEPPLPGPAPFLAAFSLRGPPVVAAH